MPFIVENNVSFDPARKEELRKYYEMVDRFEAKQRHSISVNSDALKRAGSADWKNIDHAVKIRNHVIHPKSMTDISVSEAGAECCYNAFLYVHNMLFTTILGFALTSLNKAAASNNKSLFFSSAK
jgi:hypothetical protein